jgi:hypothetical protein
VVRTDFTNQACVTLNFALDHEPQPQIPTMISLKELKSHHH